MDPNLQFEKRPSRPNSYCANRETEVLRRELSAPNAMAFQEDLFTYDLSNNATFV